MSTKEIHIEVDREDFSDIIDQKKTALVVENDGEFYNCKKRDIIVLHVTQAKIHFVINSVKKYKNIEDLFDNENYKLFYPSALDKKNALEIVRNKNLLNCEDGYLAIHFSLFLFLVQE